MLTRLPARFYWVFFVFTAFVLSFLPQPAQSQCGYADLKHNRVRFRNASGNPIVVGNFFTGVLEYLPDGYDPNGSATYPVIIYFHGYLAVGEGTDNDLCRLFSDQRSSLPGRLEDGLWPATIRPGGTGSPMKYMVLSPQFNAYSYPSNYPTAQHVSALIDYLVTKYKINLNRIYLTGMSTGANMVMEYAGSSLARAQRVAGISSASLCAPLSNYPDGGKHIAQAFLPAWLVQCVSDESCGVHIPQGWVDAINANEPVANPNNPIFNILSGNNNPDTLRNCRGFTHDTWTALYNPGFKVNNMNLFEWSLSNARAILPVTMKSFDANLVNGKVELTWTTLNETGNASFTVERSADGHAFQPLGTLKGSGSSTTERDYGFTDDRPLANLSYYRLLQKDLDGQQEYSLIKKILNRTAGSKRLLVTPNPFTTELSAFIQLDKKQRVLITLTDMNGRRITQINSLYNEGSTEIHLPTGSLNKGIYLLKVTGETIAETQKVIRQ